MELCVVNCFESLEPIPSSRLIMILSLVVRDQMEWMPDVDI